MRKQFLILFLGMVLVSLAFVSAANIGTFKEGDSIQLTNYCSTGDCTYANITQVVFPDGTIDNINKPMTQTGQNFNYTFSNTSEVGTYTFKTCSDPSSTVVCDSDTFDITVNGQTFTTGTSVFYIALLGIIVFLFIVVAVGISKVSGKNIRRDDGSILSISKVKYFKGALLMFAWGLIMSLLYISSSLASGYLIDSSFGSFLFMLYRLSFYVLYIGIFIYLIWLFVNFVEDRKIKRLFERGVLE